MWLCLGDRYMEGGGVVVIVTWRVVVSWWHYVTLQFTNKTGLASVAVDYDCYYSLQGGGQTSWFWH